MPNLPFILSLSKDYFHFKPLCGRLEETLAMIADAAVRNVILAINLVTPAMLIKVAAQNMIERGVSA